MNHRERWCDGRKGRWVRARETAVRLTEWNGDKVKRIERNDQLFVTRMT